MSVSPKILILGGGGMLGHRLWLDLGKRFKDVTVTVRKSRTHYKNFLAYAPSVHLVDEFSVSEWSNVEDLLTRVRPDFIVNCIAVTKRKENAVSASEEIALNALFPHLLADWAAQQNSRVIHFSTDCVFDGKSGGYTESDFSNAQDLYGRSKALGEISGSSALTLRTSFIGREIDGHTELLEWFISQRGKSVQGFKHALYSGITTGEGARIVIEIIEKHPKLSGLWHVASEKISKFDLLEKVNRQLHLGIEIAPNETFRCFRNLNGNRFTQEVGIAVSSWDQMIGQLATESIPYQTWRKV